MKVILLGDSITEGLGSKKINFAESLKKELGNEYCIYNLAKTGTTIEYGLKIYDKVNELEPDLVIIMYGNVDAQIRPNRKCFIYKMLPNRFKGNGMLSPRPFYSKKWHKRLFQKMDNLMRTMFRNLIYFFEVPEQEVDIKLFQETYNALLDSLVNSTICLCSTVYIDEKYFPGSQKEYEKYNAVIKSIADERKYIYIDLYELFREVGWSFYNEDHFHPNGDGYLLISKELNKKLNRLDKEKLTQIRG